MKFTKHQKEIIRRINDGEVYDIYSYLKSFDMLYNFKIDKTIIEAKFAAEEGDKKYKTLKPGVSTNSIHMDNKTFEMYIYQNQLKDEDFEYKPAELVFDKIKGIVSYKEIKYEFNPCVDKGINIAVSFNQIKEFISIWSYLHKELYVLEVPKAIRKEEIGLFFERCSKKVEESTTNITDIQKHTFLKNLGIENKLIENFTWSSEAPKIDAYKYADEFLEFNEDNFTICDYYLDKKILSTPELELFIKNRFNNSEQINFYWALIPAYLAIIVSILIPLFQKQDNTEVIKIQNQLREIQQEVSQLEITNSQLQSVIAGLDNMKIEQFDDRELKEILLKIIEVIERE
jgi:hypothetical protein